MSLDCTRNTFGIRILQTARRPLGDWSSALPFFRGIDRSARPVPFVRIGARKVGNALLSNRPPSSLRLSPDFEDAIRAIPGVRAASVVTDAHGVPTEVHVVTGDEKAAKQFVRDIQSVAMASFDFELDHRVVSIVQLPTVGPHTLSAVAGDERPAVEDPEAQVEADLPRRAVLTAIDLTNRESTSDAKVTLTLDDLELTGMASGPKSIAQRPRLVAEATLRAVGELLGWSCHVDSAQMVSAGNSSVAVTTISAAIPRLGNQVFSGSAVVRDDESDAVARSVLAAVNRHISN